MKHHKSMNNKFLFEIKMEDGPRVSFNGFLELKRDPGPWIQNNPHSLLLVRCLCLDLQAGENMGDSIGDFTELTSLYFDYRLCDESLMCLPSSIIKLHKLKHLELRYWKLDELPAILGQLVSLSKLTLSYCASLKSLPSSVTNLSNLTSLHFDECGALRVTQLMLNKSLTHLSFHYCSNMTVLPENLQHLSNLKHLSLIGCANIKSLPKTIINLCNLKTLLIQDCPITDLPVITTVMHLELRKCGIKLLPQGLINLQRLLLDILICSAESLSNVKDSPSLRHFTIAGYNNDKNVEWPADFNQFVNLKMLSLRLFTDELYSAFIDQLQANEGWLAQFMLLDITETKIKWLPWSITKLSKLKVLMLPTHFRLQTLPSHLIDSLLISVERIHVRKTWKQLKQQIFPIVPVVMAMEAAHQEPSMFDPPGYLQLTGDPRPWIHDNLGSSKLVRMLDWTFSEINQDITDSIRLLPLLTYLYIDVPFYSIFDIKFKDKITAIKHLSISGDMTFICRSLSMLCNLESLHLNFSFLYQSLDMDLPVSLRSLSLEKIRELPDSIAKLSNLQTLILSQCYRGFKFPANFNIPNIKLSDCSIKSLPTALHNLEILHSKYFCTNNDACSSLLESVKNSVNLETLSVTCYKIKCLPSIERLHKLQKLQLKDCFNLRRLPPKVDGLINLCDLNVSGSRIKSLSRSFMKLPKLRLLILPKCFRQDTLLSNVKMLSVIDDTDETYYEIMDYNDSCYETSSETEDEGNDTAPGSSVRVYEPGLEEFVQGVFVDTLEQGAEDSQINGSNDPMSENSQHALEIEGMDTMALENEEVFPPCDAITCTHEQNNHHTLDDVQSKNPESDASMKGKTKKQEITLEMIQDLMSRNMRLVDAAEQLGVSRSTLKRKLKEYKITWPSSSFRKQHSAANKRKDIITESPNGSHTSQFHVEKPAKLPKHGLDQECLNGASPTMKNVKEPPMDQQTEVHLDGGRQHTIVRPYGDSNTFAVKATYKEDTVKFDFSLTSSIDQLNEVVGTKFELGVNTFKLKYQDEDKDWLLMTCISDLKDAWHVSRSSGLKYVRLFVIDKQVLNTGKKRRDSKENLELSVSKPEGEKFNQSSNEYSFPYPEHVVSFILPYIIGHINVKGDGNCGFRVIAIFEYGDEEKWLDVKRDLMEELTTHKELYNRALGSDKEYKKACHIASFSESPAPEEYWYEATCLGMVAATKYQKIFTYWSDQCMTFLPLETRLANRPPAMYINMARLWKNHFIALDMPTNIPLPPLMPLWKSHCNTRVKDWHLSVFKLQLDHYHHLKNLH